MLFTLQWYDELDLNMDDGTVEVEFLICGTKMWNRIEDRRYVGIKKN